MCISVLVYECGFEYKCAYGYVYKGMSDCISPCISLYDIGMNVVISPRV